MLLKNLFLESINLFILRTSYKLIRNKIISFLPTYPNEMNDEIFNLHFKQIKIY